MSIKASDSVKFNCGSVMKNRFMLAPLTNQQSYEDGKLSNEEYHWLTLRAKGDFGLVMTCASHVQEIGKGFSGQLGIFSDALIEGHKKLSSGIKSYGSLAVIQLHHAGMRSPFEVIKQKAVCPSKSEKHNARALTLEEIHTLRNDFIKAASRAQKCGYDGVEVHGAHGYIITQFLSSEINTRNDEYGGSLENRSRLLFEIVNGIREACGKQFLDLSLWDCFKFPEEYPKSKQTLLGHITDLNFKTIKLTVAGNIRTGKDVQEVLYSGVDFVTIGRSGILHHDFPKQVLSNPNFKPIRS